MNKPKAEKIELPYASTVASFFNDQGAPGDGSFLGRLYRGADRRTQVRVQGGVAGGAPAGAGGVAAPFKPRRGDRN